MHDKNLYNKKSPKYYVRKYFELNKNSLTNKVIVDFPAGNGVMSEFLRQLGAKVLAFDLFPEYFSYPKITCQRVDIEEGIPLDNETADIVLCQEGIEHFPNQLSALKEFNRILKTNGTLIITTPSYSNIASKLSYLLFESENFKQMPPNEFDDVWMHDKNKTNKIYYGHLFLIGIQKLRTLAFLAGFEIKEARHMRLSKSSLLFFPVFYIFIVLSSVIRYLIKLYKIRKLSNTKNVRNLYKQQMLLNISPKHLLNRHLFIIFVKKNNNTDNILSNEDCLISFNSST